MDPHSAIVHEHPEDMTHNLCVDHAISTPKLLAMTFVILWMSASLFL
jgi:hypothetical protein